jgi:ankyrin repeat protein
MEKCIEYYDSGQRKLRHIEIDKPKEDIRKKILQNNRILIGNVLFHNFLSIILNKSHFNLFLECYEELLEYSWNKVNSNDIIWIQTTFMYTNLIYTVSSNLVNTSIVKLLEERKRQGGKIKNSHDSLQDFIKCHREIVYAIQEYIYIIQSFIWVYQTANNEYNDIFPTILSKYAVIINSVRLLAACKEGEIHVINELLDDCCVVDIKNNHGETPLDLIIKTGNLDTLKKVVKQCININITDDMGKTSLMKAASEGQTEVVKLLLTHHSLDINKQDIQFQTALMMASINGHTDVVKELLNYKGIDVNIRNSEGIPALIATADKGHFDIVKLLLKFPGIYKSLLTEEFKDSMKYWFDDDNTHLIELLRSGRKGDVSMSHQLKYSLLFIVVCIGDIEKTKLLLKCSRVNVNWKDSYGRTPLMMAIMKRHDNIVSLLLDQSKININMKDNDGNSALTYAAMYSSSDIVYSLLEYKKISHNPQNNLGYTPVMTAAENGNKDAINVFLLNKKVKFNIENEIGETALIIAIEKGHYEIVRMLIESKRKDIYSGHGDNNIKLLQYAVNSGHADIASLFIGSITIKSGSFYSTDELSVDSNKSNSKNTTGTKSSKNNILSEGMNVSVPFFTAAEKGYLSIIKLFIEMKIVDINVKDSLNETALMKATFNGHVRLVKYLLKQPNINVRQWNVEGLTALDIAQNIGNVEIISLIKQYFKQKSTINDSKENLSGSRQKYYRRSSENFDRDSVSVHSFAKSSSDQNLSAHDLIGVL